MCFSLNKAKTKGMQDNDEDLNLLHKILRNFR